MDIQFFVPGEPRGKGRARFYNAGKFIKSYTPQETASYENKVQLFFCAANPGFKAIGKGVPVNVTVEAFFSIPASWSKKQRAAQETCPVPATKKPDADNIGKIVCDALNKLAWSDDAQVTRLLVTKRYGNAPGCKVSISWETSKGQ
jgi:Holliday junction resolvase RusA-like endonuclease